MIGKTMAVTPASVWNLHQDVVRLARATEDLCGLLENYPILEMNKWREMYGPDLEEYHREYPDAAEFIARAAEALKQIGRLRELADSIYERRALLYWFARAYMDWPSVHLLAENSNSRHEEVFAAADGYIAELFDIDRIREFVLSQSTDTAHLDSIVEAHLFTWYRRGVCFDDMTIEALKREATLAVKICESSGGTAGSGGNNSDEDDSRDAEFNAWLYEQRQNNRKTWATILSESHQVRAKHGWPKLASTNAVRNRVVRYAADNRLPLRKGKGGAPRRRLKQPG